MPVCPSCGKALGWRDISSFWNPWNYPCPHCKVVLEASPIQKRIALATVPAGIGIACVAIYFRKSSLAFLAVVVVFLVVGALMSWPRTTFKVKGK